MSHTGFGLFVTVCVCVCLSLCVCVCVCSREGQQVFQYSTSVKNLLLVVHVTNSPSPGQPAEDAHNALLNMTIPPSLLYSGVRSEVSVL